MNLYKIEENVMERIGFKAQMSNLEIYGTKAMIDEMAEDEVLPFNTEEMGLAYTSSSGYGMLNVCNFDPEFEDGTISHFAVLNDGRLFMVTNGINGDTNTYYVVE